MNAALELIRTLGVGRIAAIGALSATIVGIAAFAFLRVSQPQMTPLFTDLAYEDSTAIVSELDGLNIPFEIRQDGAVILVPKDEVFSLRMRLAESGLPAGGGVGYEIFDNSDSLGATSFVQNLNHLRALEGELARTIRAIDRVKAARVHLVLPEQKLFSREAAEPSASIMLKLRGALGGGQIKAIQHIVASAVKDMKPERVSVVDDRGQLLASGTGAADGQIIMSAMEERNRTLEDRMRRQVEAIVGNVVGPNAVKVQVSAELDLSRSTETEDIYDPDGQVVRSSQTREETAASNDRGAAGGVSVGNELPGAGEADPATGAQDTNSKTEEVVNFEISKRTRTEVQEAGRIKRLSVAVLVDGAYSQEGSDVVYTPRPPEQMEQITALVRSAMGFNRERGDTLEVVNLRFAPDAAALEFGDESDSFLELTKDDYFRIAEVLVLALVGLLIVFFVVRPLLRRALDPEQSRSVLESAAEAGGETRAIAGPDDQGRALPSPEAAERLNSAERAGTSVTELIDTARLTGQMQETSIRKVAELVKGNPDEAIGIIRQWVQTPAYGER